MRKLILTLAAIAAISLTISCKHTKETRKEDLLSAYQLVDTTHFKKSVLKGLHEYLNRHTEAKAIVLVPSLLYLKENAGKTISRDNGCRRIYNEVYFLRKADASCFGEGEFSLSRNYPTHYFKIGDKLVFLSNESDGLANQNMFRKSFEKLVDNDRGAFGETENMLVYDLKDSVIFIPNTVFNVDSMGTVCGIVLETKAVQRK